jgi:Transposase IS116/IS110/IS902 family
VALLRVVLRQLLTLCQLRATIEDRAEVLLANDTDYQRLRCIPGIGPITALTVLAEAGDLRRFSHHRQFLNFCGLDLATEQSGSSAGSPDFPSVAMRGCVLSSGWPPASPCACGKTVSGPSSNATCEPIQAVPIESGRLTSRWPAKISRVAYALIRSGADYRCFPEVCTGR